MKTATGVQKERERGPQKTAGEEEKKSRQEGKHSQTSTSCCGDSQQKRDKGKKTVKNLVTIAAPMQMQTHPESFKSLPEELTRQPAGGGLAEGKSKRMARSLLRHLRREEEKKARRAARQGAIQAR